jgi:transposase-like protein
MNSHDHAGSDDADRIAQGHLNDDADRFIRLLALARSKGATVRALARLVGESKSTIGRWLPAIDAVASQMGQQRANSPEISEGACPARDTEVES